MSTPFEPAAEIAARICPLTVQEIVGRVLTATEKLCDTVLYAYQRGFVLRVIESILVNDGHTITALWARQCGKSTAVACLAVSLCVWLPLLAELYPDDDRLSPFIKGFRIGIFAPIDDQARETFAKMRDIAESDHLRAVLDELRIGDENGEGGVDISVTSSRGDMIGFSNGSLVRSRTASEAASIEGKTYELVIAEEAQDISKSKVEKSIRPMLASTNGTMVKIGTAGASRGGFHTSIQSNVDRQLRGGPRDHFEIPYDVVIREKNAMYAQEQVAYAAETAALKRGEIKVRTVPAARSLHLKYGKYLQGEIVRLGGRDTIEFRMNYMCEWMESRVIAIDPVTFAQAALVDMESTCGPVMMGVQVGGLDLGKLHDRSVLTTGYVDMGKPYRAMVVGPESDPDKLLFYPKYVQDWLMLEGPFEGTNGQYEMIVDYVRHTRMKVLAVDATGLGGDTICERLEVLLGDTVVILPCNFSSMKGEGYKYFLQELKSRRVFYPAGPRTQRTVEYRFFVQEHLDLVREVSANGRTMIHAPEDDDEAHDDFPDSLMLMCWAEKMMPEVVMPDIEVVGAAGRNGRGVSSGGANRGGSRHARR